MDGIQMARSPDQVRRVVGQWGPAGSALAEVRLREVADLTDAEAEEATLDLLAILDTLPPLPLRPTSGLVEQQRWFMRIRNA